MSLKNEKLSFWGDCPLIQNLKHNLGYRWCSKSILFVFSVRVFCIFLFMIACVGWLGGGEERVRRWWDCRSGASWGAWISLMVLCEVVGRGVVRWEGGGGGEVMVREGKGSWENTNYPAAAREWCVGSTGRGPPVEPGECRLFVVSYVESGTYSAPTLVGCGVFVIHQSSFHCKGGFWLSPSFVMGLRSGRTWVWWAWVCFDFTREQEKGKNACDRSLPIGKKNVVWDAFRWVDHRYSLSELRRSLPVSSGEGVVGGLSPAFVSPAVRRSLVLLLWLLYWIAVSMVHIGCAWHSDRFNNLPR